MRRLTRNRYHQLRTRTHRWLERHPLIARILDYTGCMGVDDHVIARGVAIGLFIGLTPTVGVQTLLMIALCMLVRGNFPAAFLVSWVSNPLTMAPLYFAFNVLGRAVFEPIVHPGLSLTGLEGIAVKQASFTALGSLLVAGPMAVLGYVAALWIWRLTAHHRQHAGVAAAAPRREDDAQCTRDGRGMK